MKRRQRVLLLFGGRSAEHDVSRVTAVAVARALDRTRYDVVPVAITTDGRWLLADSAQRARSKAAARRAAERVRPSTATARRRASRVRSTSTSCSRCSTVPTARTARCRACSSWPTCPTSDRACVGSAVAMDKVMMKRAFAAAGLPYAHDGRVPRRRTTATRWSTQVEARARLPVLREAGQPRLVDRRVEGASTAPSSTRRSTSRCATTSGSWSRRRSPDARSSSGSSATIRPMVSLPGEIVPGDDFYSYADKYEADDAQLLVPGAARRRPGRRGAGARGAGVRGLPLRGDGAGRPVPRGTSTARSSSTR